MKKYLLHFWLLAAILSFAACDSSNNEEEWIEPKFDTEAVYILNEGDWKTDDGSLTFYNIETDKSQNNVFFNQNNLKLGNLPNAMLAYNDRIFIVVHGSNAIFVTDLSGKLIVDGILDFDKTDYKKPRNIVELNGKLFVNFYTGHLAQIDATTLAVEKVIAIEKNTEQMTIASNKKLYIADTDQGNGSTVSVINLASFSKEASIKVPLNPAEIVSDNLGNVYVASWGQSWADPKIAAEFSRISTNDNVVHPIGTNIATRIGISESKVLLAFTTYDEANIPHTAYSYYDIYAGKHKEEPFFILPTTTPEEEEGEKPEGEKTKNTKADEINHAAYLDNAYSITVDPIKKDIYITTSSYTSTGRVYIFSEQGNYKTSFNSGGINPNSVIFVKKQVN